MSIPTNPSFSRSGRSGPADAHASAAGVRVSDMHGAEFSGIEQIQLVEPDDYASRQARLHRESARSDRAVSLELEREVCWVRSMRKPAPRVPSDTEPCTLVGFIGIVAGGTAAALAALALAGWTLGAVAEMGLQWVGVR